MNAGRIAGLLGIATLVFAQGPALACGDKLSMMGGGVSFELVNPNRHRANVILFAPPDSPLRLGKQEQSLQKSLQRAGHKVRTVGTSADLTSALQAGNVDIVLTEAGDAAATASRVAAEPAAQVATAPLALSYRPTAADFSSSAPNRTCVTRLDSRGKQLLEAIENVLANRGQVIATNCSPASVTSST